MHLIDRLLGRPSASDDLKKRDPSEDYWYQPLDVCHLRALPLRDGLRGTSRVWMGRESIGTALALRDFAARFFANDATPPFVIEHPTHFKDTESRKNYLGAIKRWWGGERRHSPGVLEPCHRFDAKTRGRSPVR